MSKPFSVKVHAVRAFTYVFWVVFVGIPLLLSFIPYSWGKVFDSANTLLESPVLGSGTLFMTLAAPALFGWIYYREKNKKDLIALIVSVIYLLFVIAVITQLARSLKDF